MLHILYGNSKVDCLMAIITIQSTEYGVLRASSRFVNLDCSHRIKTTLSIHIQGLSWLLDGILAYRGMFSQFHN